MVVNDYNPNIWEAEEGGARVQSQPKVSLVAILKLSNVVFQKEQQQKTSKWSPYKKTQQQTNKHPAKHTNSSPSHPRDHTLQVLMAVSQLDKEYINT